MKAGMRLRKKAYMHTLEGVLVLFIMLSYITMVLPSLGEKTIPTEQSDRAMQEALQVLLYSGELDNAILTHNSSEVEMKLNDMLPLANISIELEYVDISVYKMSTNELNISKDVSAGKDIILDLYSTTNAQTNVSINNKLTFSGVINEFVNLNLTSYGIVGTNNISIRSTSPLNYIVLKLVERESDEPQTTLRKSTSMPWWINESDMVVINAYVS